MKPCWTIGCATAVLLLTGCRSATTRLYSLEPAAAATHVAVYQAPALRIDTLNVPASWDRIQLLKPAATALLEISDFDHWSAPLAQLARQALSDDLDQRLPPGSVIYPRLPKSGDALGINVDILEFNVVASKASMQVSWIILPSWQPQNPKRNVASLRSSMSSTEPAAVAHAWSELLGQLADRIAVDAAGFTKPN